MSNPEQTDSRTRRRKVFDYLIYLVLRTLVFAVRVMPWFAVQAFARLLAWCCYTLDRRHRDVALGNLRHAFPEMDESDLIQLCRRSFRHFVLMLCEMMRIPVEITRSNVDDYFKFSRPESRTEMMEVFVTDRPVLALTGHFGNWEVFNYMAGVLGYEASVVARKLDNPHVDRYLDRLRSKTGQRMLDKRYDYPEILNCLQRGEMLGMLADQDAGNRGLFVDFMGRPASTFKSIAVLSLTYSAPIMVFGAARVGRPMNYRLYLEDIIMPEDYAQRPDAVQAITQRYCDALAKLIERHPEQYFWFHRRWKTPPKERRLRAAA